MGINLFRNFNIRQNCSTYHHSTAASNDLNDFGLPRRKLCMLESASRAVPSTTSKTARPINDGISCLFAVCTAIAPPILQI